MAIGAYRHRLAVENPGTTVPDGDGGYTAAYAPADPPYVDASITAATARDLERVTAGTVLATATHLIRTRFHPGITTDTRLLFEGRRFEVQSVQNVDQRDIALILICAELQADAPIGTSGPPSGVGRNTAPGWRA
jgi:head-tail adaptor